jgi:Endosomal/lysosomal potassium channel TMEM175
MPSETLKLSRDGFRLRGREMTRIETFTDAAFAFSLTLLVISMDPPASYAELGSALRDIPAFLLSATLLMSFWWGHHEWSRRYGMEDGATVVLSCLLVFTVLVYVYPLRFMFGLMMAWIGMITGLPLGTRRVSIAGPGDVNEMFALYGVGYVAMCLTLALLYHHAWRCRDALGLNALERFYTRSSMGVWLLLATTGALSVAVALAVPPTWVGAPGWAYMLLPVVMPLYGRVTGRKQERLRSKDGTAAAQADVASGGRRHGEPAVRTDA